MTDYGDPSLFYVDSEIGIFDLEDAIIEYLPETAANLMAIKSLSRSWRWGALTAFHWEGAVICKRECGKHVLLNPTKLQKPNAQKVAWCCDGRCGDFCTCNIPKCLKTDDELEEQIGGYPAFEFLGIDFDFSHAREVCSTTRELQAAYQQPSVDSVYFDSWPQEVVVAIRFMQHCDPSSNEEINNKLLERFGPRNLRLFVAANAPVSPAALEKCSKLKWLDLFNARDYVNGETLSAVVKLPQLKLLRLDFCDNIPQDNFKLLRDNKSVEQLSLFRIANDAIVKHVSHLSSLQSLVVSGNDMTDSVFSCFKKGRPPLRRLRTPFAMNLTEKGFAEAAKIATLRELDFSTCFVKDIVMLEVAEKLPQLEVFLLAGGMLTDQGVGALGRLTSLWHLELTDLPNSVGPEVFNAALENLTQLRVLDFARARGMQTAHLKFLQNLTELEVLFLSNCDEIDDDALSYFSPLRKLKKLNLNDCQRITSDGIAHLSHLSRIEWLNLNLSKVEDTALQHICGLTKMRWLHLSSCKEVTDEGLEFLRELQELEFLDLTDCDKTSSSGVVRCMEKMNKFKFLRAKGSEEKAKGVRERFPWVDVVFKR